VDSEKPKHIAIIPDGNRRWAEMHGLSRQEAYAKGIEHIGDVLKWCRVEDVRMLTMWGFSLENFKRDEAEIKQLFGLFKDNLKKGLESDDRNKYDVKIKFFGRIHLFPKEIQEMIRKTEQMTSKNKEYQLNLLLSYGGRAEIVDAVNSIIDEGIKEVNEEILSRHMYTAEVPDPDLVIRTSGEKRLSGLLPWQCVYSEFYFSEKLWPDFNKEDFQAALEDYAKRKRRYGK